MSFSKEFINKNISSLSKVDNKVLDKMVSILAECKKKNGRLFLIGVGGSAGHCSHAVNDFRKICNLQSFTPTDNVSELTARINDEGWENSYKNYLKGSKLNSNDVLMVYSVGGGSKEKNISVNLINCIDYSKEIGCKIISVIGKETGYANKKSDVFLVFDIDDSNFVTPITEGLTSVIWHFLVTHPDLMENKTTWESIK